jgi:ATP-dependent exoDNAse (exonuclease V) beta subunit
LTSYIRNPLDFYFQKILKINAFEEVEETIAANTLGTIVHDTLESFYKPFEGVFLTSELLLKLKEHIHEEVTKQFRKTFKSGSFNTGKNLIIFEVAKRYISNFIDYELSEINAGNQIKILQIERTLAVEIPISEIDFPVRIGGKVDRVDEYNGQIRIIDYKTGKVEQSHLEIVNWSDITQDYKYSKVVQVLAYALMINKDMPISKFEAGIISFKNLNRGFLKFSTKEKPGGRTKNQEVTQETLELFIVELKKLILEITDPNIPFIEKEIDA